MLQEAFFVRFINKIKRFNLQRKILIDLLLLKKEFGIKIYQAN